MDENRRGLVLEEGGWVYTALVLVGWEHNRLMRGEANLCKVFWSILLGVPFVGTFRYINWTFTEGAWPQRAVKIGGLALGLVLLLLIAVGPHWTWAVIVFVLGLAGLATVILFLAFGVLLGAKAVKDGPIPSALTKPTGEFFSLIGHKWQAVKARICPPILFAKRA